MARPILWSKVLAFGFSGGVGAFVGAGLGAAILYGVAPNDLTGKSFFNSLWEALLTVCLFSLLAAVNQNRYLQGQKQLRLGSGWIILGAGLLSFVGSFLWAGVLQGIWNTSQDLATNIRLLIIPALIIWGSFGCGLGLLSTTLIPNIRRISVAFAVGILWFSVVMGSLICQPQQNNPIYWVFFDMLKGLGLGLILPILECLTAKSWLQLENGSQPQVINLGKQPIGITAAGKLCLMGETETPDLVLRYRQEQGQIICDDFLSQVSTPPEIGKQRVVGNSRITVWGSSAATATPVGSKIPSQQESQPPTPKPPQPESKPRHEYTLLLSDGSSLVLKLGIRLNELELRGLESAHPDQRTVAEVNSHPQHPELLGLKNHSLQTWQLKLPDEEPRPIEPGRSARLSIGNHIKFVDFMEGEIMV